MVIKAHELEYISKNNSSGNPSHLGRVEDINYWIDFDKRERSHFRKSVAFLFLRRLELRMGLLKRHEIEYCFENRLGVSRDRLESKYPEFLARVGEVDYRIRFRRREIYSTSVRDGAFLVSPDEEQLGKEIWNF